MKFLKLLLIIFISYFFINESIAQNKKQIKKWNETINALKETSFVKQYLQDKEKIETQIKTFHALKEQNQVSQADIEAVRKGYIETIDAYDAVLTELKTRFTNRKTRSAIQKSTEDFTRDLESKIETANKTYNTNCLVIIDRTIHQHDGAFGLMEVSMLISLSKEIYSLYQKKLDSIDQEAGNYIDRNFIKDLRLKKWETF